MVTITMTSNEVTPTPLDGLKGGKKQQFNRQYADLIVGLHDALGFDKAKEVFKLSSDTLVDILKRHDRHPAIKKVDRLELRHQDITNRVYEVMRDSLQHKTKHDNQRELWLALIEVLEKAIIPIARKALEAGFTEIDESQHDFELRTDKLYVTSSKRRKQYIRRPY